MHRRALLPAAWPGTAGFSTTSSTWPAASASAPASCPPWTPRCCWPACCMRPSSSTATMRPRPRSAAPPRPSASASTGAGPSTAARRSATAGTPRAASSPATGKATTRPCWSTCWRWAARVARGMRWHPKPGTPGPAPTTAAGPPSTATPTCTSRRCSATSTPTAGSTSAASATPTCVHAASTTSRTAAAPRWPSAPMPRPIRWVGAATAATSGASPPATARPTWCGPTGASSASSSATPAAASAGTTPGTTAPWHPPLP